MILPLASPGWTDLDGWRRRLAWLLSEPEAVHARARRIETAREQIAMLAALEADRDRAAPD